MRYLLIFILLLVGCAGSGIEYNAPEIDADLCMEYDVSKSLIKKVASDNGLTLAQIYYPLIDATAIAMLADALDREAVRDYLMDVRMFVESKPILSYTYLIKFMTDRETWGHNWELIESILYRRINLFGSSMIISEHDRCLILHGLEGAERDLYL